MIDLLKKDHLQIFWIVFHVLLGVAATYFAFILIAWIYVLIGSSAWSVLTKGNRNGVVHNFLAYYLGMEILARAIQASPIVPYESGKYCMVAFLIAGLLFTSRGSRLNVAGWVILGLSIPSLMVARGEFEYTDIVFNYLGVFNLALALIYFYKINLSEKGLLTMFRLCIYSIIPLLVSVTLKTPDFDDLEFSLAASFETTAGFGSNQVSTILGLGFLLIGYCYLTGQKIFSDNWISIALFGLFFFRGLLTFSRGGVIAGVLVLLLVFVATYFWPMKKRIRGTTLAGTVFVFVALAGISIYANRLTDNILMLRYQGETESTLAGKREKDISLMTSGRLDVFLSDVRIWSENFWLGVGPGESSNIREERGLGKVAAHVEISRLLSEHGLMGFFISLMLLTYPFKSFLVSRRNSERLLKICLFSFAILTSFHSAMRTNVTPFLFGLAAVQLVPNDYLLRRYQMVRKYFRNEAVQLTPNT